MFAKVLAFSLILSALPAYAADEYVFILRARSNPYWDAVVAGIKETAATHGVKASIYQTQTDTAAEEQLNICEAVLARQPKVLALSAITNSVGIQCMKQAAAQGIIIADMDAGVLPEVAQKAGLPLAFSVGSDNYKIGQNAAAYLKTIAKNSTLKILVLEGAPGSTQGQKRINGFRDGVKTALPQAEIVMSASADWDRLKAMQITNDTLQRSPDLNVIYAANDLMALGAAEAVHAAGKSDVTIIGVDGTADARKAVLDGRLAATVAQLPYFIGKRATEKAMDVTAGKKTDRMEVTPTPVLTKDMLQAGTDPVLKYVR